MQQKCRSVYGSSLLTVTGCSSSNEGPSWRCTLDPAALLVALIVGLFKKLSDKGGDRIAEALTDAAAAKVRELLDAIQERLRPEDPTEITLAELKRDPANTSLERVLTAQISQVLTDDRSLNDQLTDLLRQLMADNRLLVEALQERPAALGAQAVTHGSGHAVALHESPAAKVVIGGKIVEIQEADRPAAVPRELPPEPRYFTGRAALAAGLVRDLRRREDAVPRVLITGEPGVGKTGLALHVAHMLRRTDYPDIQLFIPLSTGGEVPVPVSPATALYDVLVALDVPRDRIPAGIEARQRRYRAELHGKAVLVVLDDAMDADQVEALVPPAGCTMIMTSRDELHEVLAEDARAVRLQPLSRREAVGYLAKRIGPGRVTREPTGALRIVKACDGLPLALSVVAAQLTAESGRTLNLNEVSWRLSYEQTRVKQLTAGRRSVHGALARRYRTLTDEQREVLHVLGVLNTSDLDVGVVAAALGVSEEDAAARLRDLVDAGLLEVADGR
jgi:hypothetical protein